MSTLGYASFNRKRKQALPYNLRLKFSSVTYLSSLPFSLLLFALAFWDLLLFSQVTIRLKDAYTFCLAS